MNSEPKDLLQDALNNLQHSAYRHFSIDRTELGILSNWTDVCMFLMEARKFLQLSEKYNEKKNFTDIDESLLAHGLFRNSVISYAKCFTSSGNKKISLDLNQVFAHQPDLRHFHDRLLSIRHTYVAHNDQNDMNLALNLTAETDDEITLAATYTLKTPLNEYRDYYAVIDQCERYVITALNKKLDKLEKATGKRIKIAQ